MLLVNQQSLFDQCLPSEHFNFANLEIDSHRSMEWPGKEKVYRINDSVYGAIHLPYPLNVIVDTVEFQRLRNLKQTGLVELVYPGCDHKRFVHSLGVFHLSYEVVKKIRENEPHLKVTSADHLSVCIGALLHDIGHGPFSHTFDGPLAYKLDRSWKHEEMSIRIVNRLLLNNTTIRSKLEPFYGTSSFYEQNVDFIKELIVPKVWEEDHYVTENSTMEENKENIKFNWWAKGQPFEKSFLYDIISNTSNMHDVDKMDYLLRDSKASGVAISISPETITRLIDNIRVVKNEVTGVRHIGYNRKVVDDVKMIGDSRQDLHLKVYKHRTVLAAEKMLVEALVLAADHLEYEGTGGKMIKLKDIYDDVEAFLKISDCIVSEIMNSTKPELKKAKQILRDMTERKFMKSMADRLISPLRVKEISEGNNYIPSHHTITNLIETEIKKYLTEEEMKRISVQTREMGKGFMSCHPVERQLFFNGKLSETTVEPIGSFLEDEWCETNSPVISTKWDIFVLGDPDLTSEDREKINDALTNAVTTLKLVTPRKRAIHESEPSSPPLSRRRLVYRNS